MCLQIVHSPATLAKLKRPGPPRIAYKVIALVGGQPTGLYYRAENFRFGWNTDRESFLPIRAGRGSYYPAGFHCYTKFSVAQGVFKAQQGAWHYYAVVRVRIPRSAIVAAGTESGRQVIVATKLFLCLPKKPTARSLVWRSRAKERETISATR